MLKPAHLADPWSISRLLRRHLSIASLRLSLNLCMAYHYCICCSISYQTEKPENPGFTPLGTGPRLSGFSAVIQRGVNYWSSSPVAQDGTYKATCPNNIWHVKKLPIMVLSLNVTMAFFEVVRSLFPTWTIKFLLFHVLCFVVCSYAVRNTWNLNIRVFHLFVVINIVFISSILLSRQGFCYERKIL